MAVSRGSDRCAISMEGALQHSLPATPANLAQVLCKGIPVSCKRVLWVHRRHCNGWGSACVHPLTKSRKAYHSFPEDVDQTNTFRCLILLSQLYVLTPFLQLFPGHFILFEIALSYQHLIYHYAFIKRNDLSRSRVYAIENKSTFSYCRITYVSVKQAWRNTWKIFPQPLKFYILFSRCSNRHYVK